MSTPATPAVLPTLHQCLQSATLFLLSTLKHFLKTDHAPFLRTCAYRVARPIAFTYAAGALTRQYTSPLISRWITALGRIYVDAVLRYKR